MRPVRWLRRQIGRPALGPVWLTVAGVGLVPIVLMVRHHEPWPDLVLAGATLIHTVDIGIDGTRRLIRGRDTGDRGPGGG